MGYFDILVPCAANGVSQYSMFMKTSREHVLHMCRSFAFRTHSSLEYLCFTIASSEAVFKKTSAELPSYFPAIHSVWRLKYFKSRLLWEINFKSSHQTLFSELSTEYEVCPAFIWLSQSTLISEVVKRSHIRMNINWLFLFSKYGPIF
jgi:hypothetical protein